ncbi:MAG TPA: EfeM/EfeO family lipoprotein [Kofleriaceae bacterium]|nr:EfeM/EfeO family lipoprotein [Kofleriaceae bacterium]
MKRTAVLTALAAASPACTGKSDDEYRAEVIAEMHAVIGIELDDLVQASHELQAAAPTHAWSETADAIEIAQMRDAWRRTRIAYEHIEGATAPLFGDLDYTLDARYDDYLEKLGPDGDRELFDATGVTGMHGIERILYANDIRPEIVAFEVTLPGYVPAAFPRTDDEAIAFKTELAQKLVDDAEALHDQWQPAAIDIGAAYQGLVGLMNEQKDKINVAATGAEESRYADITLFDLRNNLAGTKGVYESFRPWIQARALTSDDMIVARFRALTTLYGGTPGDALPRVPRGWDSEHPTPDELDTPFGRLWQAVHDNVNASQQGGIVFEMNRVAVVLGFPEFIAED